MRAILRHTRLSPKKANLIASMVRKMSVNDALSTLERLPKKGASILHGVIASATSNAESNTKQQRNALFIKKIIVNKGPAFRRFLPIARGRTRPISKWTSHILVELGVIVPDGEKGKKVVQEAKTTKKVKVKKEKKNDTIETVEKVDLRHGGASVAANTFDVSEDLQSKGSQKDTGGSTFQHQRKGSRGS